MRNLELGQLNHILTIEHAKLDVLSVIALSVYPDLPSFRESALSTNIFLGLSKDTNCFPMSPTWGAVLVHSMAISTAYSWAPRSSGCQVEMLKKVFRDWELDGDGIKTEHRI